jgi:diguanylate cyclase
MLRTTPGDGMPAFDDTLRRDDHASRMRALPRRTYRFRVLGMGLAALPIGTVLLERGAGWPWAWLGLVCFLWPHVAYLLAKRAADPLHAEKRNFLVDSVLAGSCLPLMHFNLLPSAVLVTVTCADKVNTGVRGMLLRSLPGLLAAVLVGGALTGFAIDYRSSTAVILACLPIMAVHTLAVSYSMYLMIRKVQAQNVQLQALSERDALTGLANRRHWEGAAAALLAEHHARAVPATLMLLDADRFKAINDRWGHGVGDDVLRAIAERLRARLPEAGAIGRLGGDEFVVALPMPMADAERIAETLRADVEAIRLERVPSLRLSTSIGLAVPPAAGLELREWLEAADRCLYRAKQSGRNRTETCAAGP